MGVKAQAAMESSLPDVIVKAKDGGVGGVGVRVGVGVGVLVGVGVGVICLLLKI